MKLKDKRNGSRQLLHSLKRGVGGAVPHGYCARLRIEQSGFGPWPGTLRCVLGQA